MVCTRSLAGVSNANSFLTVDNLLLKLGEVYLSGAELALFTTMVESIKQARNESAIRLFDSYSKSSNNAHFQLGVASYVSMLCTQSVYVL